MTDAELLAIASAFDIRAPSLQKTIGMVRVASIYPRDGSRQWIIQNRGGDVLNRDGEWEYQPMPSSRTDEFLARTRWSDARAAIAFARTALKL